MLSLYAWRVVALYQQIEATKVGLMRTVGQYPGATAPHIETNSDNGMNPESLLINVASSLAEEIGMESTRHQINTIIRMGMMNAPYSEFDSALDQLAVRIQEDLRTKPFFFVNPTKAGLWGKDNLFGEKVSKKFKGCAVEIRSAGNCLALNEPTASIFHLMRAMESAVQTLAKRLKMTINAQTPWKVITGGMDGKIKNMPDKTPSLKKKKDDWEAARTNLHLVGSVWRNKTMHPAESYTASQAADVFNAVRVFMTALAEL